MFSTFHNKKPWLTNENISKQVPNKEKGFLFEFVFCSTSPEDITEVSISLPQEAGKEESLNGPKKELNAFITES